MNERCNFQIYDLIEQKKRKMPINKTKINPKNCKEFDTEKLSYKDILLEDNEQTDLHSVTKHVNVADDLSAITKHADVADNLSACVINAVIFGEVKVFETFDLNTFTTKEIQKIIDISSHKIFDIMTFEYIDHKRIKGIKRIQKIANDYLNKKNFTNIR